MTRTAALVALHAAVALFGFAALFGKWLAWPPTTIVFGRTLVAAATLAVVLAFRQARKRRQATGTVPVGPRGRLNTEARAGQPTPSRPAEYASYRARALNGALLALHWVTFFAAVQASTVAIALLGFASFPVFVLALESAERRRRPSLAEGGAVLLVACGLSLLVPELRWSNAVQGLAWGVVSGFTFALLAVRNRRAVEVQGATTLALWQNVFAAACLLPFIALRAPLPGTLSLRDAGLIVVLGVGCTALAHTLFIASMRRLSAHTASVVSVLEPAYGIALAALLLGERPDLRTLAGMVLIIAAAMVATRRATR